MNEFIEQFLIESRDLVERATDDLLSLESDGTTKDQLDSVFRAVHTLKGAAGIIEFNAMATALHAVEETLAELRKNARPLTAEIATACLDCMDQVTRWLDQIQSSGGPPEGAEIAANQIVRSFSRSSGSSDPSPVTGLPEWAVKLSEGREETSTGRLIALRYRPDPDAFFHHQDPIEIIANVPDVLVVDLVLPRVVSLQDFDPYACQIEVLALTAAPRDAVAKVLIDIVGEVEIHEISTNHDLSEFAEDVRSVLEAQALMLKDSGAHGKAGHLAAAGFVALNVLRYAASSFHERQVEMVLAQSLKSLNAAPLIDAIEGALKNADGSEAPRAEENARHLPAPAARAMRVDMERVDALVNLTGELTVVKNALGHTAALALGDEATKELGISLRRDQLHFERLVGELQRAVLQIRVLPLRNVFQRLPRLVREISTTTGKPVKLVTEGETTEADAAIVESLFEPLLHIIRNSIDHGIEDAAKRASHGKPAIATIVLRARRHLEHVIVEIEDDGAGIDLGRVRQVAAQRGVASADAIAEMTDTDIVNLIFMPGFSTAREVTNLSGRGVGMDSVKAAVERIGGTVNVETVAGRGTRLQLNLPFTIMMTRVLTVEAAGQVFGFPLDTVVETTMVPRENIVPIGAGRAFALRNRTVPLVSLAESLGLSPPNDTAPHSKVVVASAGGQLGGIEVDQLGERMEVMLKPMEGLLGGLRGVAGTTLLGDGRVLIVLDVQELFQ